MGWSEERIAGRGRFNERWIFGQATTSVYSNADLVANWEGYLFYRSLFEDDVVPGKGAVVRWGSRGAHIERPIDCATTSTTTGTNPDPSYPRPGLAKYLGRGCAALRRLPERPGALRRRARRRARTRYAAIGLREGLEFRMDRSAAAEALTLRSGTPPYADFSLIRTLSGAFAPSSASAPSRRTPRRR